MSITDSQRLSLEYDCFISHDKEPDLEGRDNQARVQKLANALKEVDMESCCTTQSLMLPKNISMAKSIDKSRMIVVCITSAYISKVAGEGSDGMNDNCKKEFDYSVGRKGVENLIAVVMEPSCRDTSTWYGSVGLHLCQNLYIDFSDDSKLNECVENIAQKLGVGSERFVNDEPFTEMGGKHGRYSGMVNWDGERHGQGKMTYDDKSQYSGPFVNDKKEGHGATYIYPVDDDESRQAYKGSYHNNTQDGDGTLIWRNGDVYEGEFIDGQCTGKGIMQYANGSKFEGDFLDGHRHGDGILREENGEYSGPFKHDKKDGKNGRMKYTNGNFYKGQWKNDKKNGRGTMTYSENSTYKKYKGNWENDVREGKGTLVFVNGDSYSGDFHQDFMHGHGKTEFQNSDIYEGSYVFGKKHGKGTYQFFSRKHRDDHSTAFYRGDWVNNCMHGYGVRLYLNGNHYSGLWAQNLREGEGRMIFANGKVCEGQWANNKIQERAKKKWFKSSKIDKGIDSNKQSTHDAVGISQTFSNDSYYSNGPPTPRTEYSNSPPRSLSEFSRKR
jgi:hypothetical protein